MVQHQNPNTNVTNNLKIVYMWCCRKRFNPHYAPAHAPSARGRARPSCTSQTPYPCPREAPPWWTGRPSRSCSWTSLPPRSCGNCASGRTGVHRQTAGQSIAFPAAQLVVVQNLDEHQIGDLLDDRQGVCHTAWPENIPDTVNLFFSSPVTIAKLLYHMI